jgi:glutathione S-transferase
MSQRSGAGKGADAAMRYLPGWDGSGGGGAVEYLDVAAAKRAGGVRLVLTRGVPGPWGEAAKGIFHVKQIAYRAVAQEGGGENADLVAWTGHANAPVVVCEGERPLAAWTDILFFAERRAPLPSLLPGDPAERAAMFGLCHEICGEDGLGWNRRLMMVHQVLAVPALADSPAGAIVGRLGQRYGYSPEAAQRAPARCAEVLRLLAEQLDRQRGRGRDFLVGDALSALDVTWAAFAALVAPLPPDLCPMPEFLRAQYTAADPVIVEALDPALVAHRDAVYRDHLVLPLDF